MQFFDQIHVKDIISKKTFKFLQKVVDKGGSDVIDYPCCQVDGKKDHKN